jgi:hypothetical protein
VILLRWEERQVRLRLTALHMAISGYGLSAAISTRFTPYVRDVTAKRFDSEGDSVSGTWAPLMASTAKIRENTGFPPRHPINVRTGLMRAWASNGSFSGSLVTESTTKMSYPSSEPTGQLYNKMLMAQKGGKGPSGAMVPPRPVLGWGPKDLFALLTIMEWHIKAVIRAA